MASRSPGASAPRISRSSTGAASIGAGAVSPIMSNRRRDHNSRSSMNAGRTPSLASPTSGPSPVPFAARSSRRMIRMSSERFNLETSVVSRLELLLQAPDASWREYIVAYGIVKRINWLIQWKYLTVFTLILNALMSIYVIVWSRNRSVLAQVSNLVNDLLQMADVVSIAFVREIQRDSSRKTEVRSKRTKIVNALSLFAFLYPAVPLSVLLFIESIELRLVYALMSVRIVKLPVILSHLSVFRSTQSTTAVRNPLVRLWKMSEVRLFFSIIIIAHVIACIWFLSTSFSGDSTTRTWADLIIPSACYDTLGISPLSPEKSQNYAEKFRNVSFLLGQDTNFSDVLLSGNEPSFSADTCDFTHTPDIEQYLKSFYWVITTIMTVGYGDITAAFNNNTERMLSICVQIKEYIHDKNITGHLANRIRRHFDYLLAKQNPLRVELLLDSLPVRLRTDIIRHTHAEAFKCISMAISSIGLVIDPRFIAELVLLARPFQMTPGYKVITEGDVVEEMYFIVRGTLQATASDIVPAAPASSTLQLLKASGPSGSVNALLASFSSASSALNGAAGADHERQNQSGGNGARSSLHLPVVVGTYGEGSFFGDYFVFAKERSRVTVQAVTLSEGLSLSIQAIEQLSAQFPQEMILLEREAIAHRLLFRDVLDSEILEESTEAFGGGRFCYRANILVNRKLADASKNDIIGKLQMYRHAMRMPTGSPTQSPSSSSKSLARKLVPLSAASVAPAPSMAPKAQSKSDKERIKRSTKFMTRKILKDSLEEVEAEEGTYDLLWQGIINPSATGKAAWDTLIGLFTMWSCIVVPVQVSFGLTEGAAFFDGVISLFFVADILVTFRTAYLDENDLVLVTSPRLIARRYLQRTFILDIVSSGIIEMIYLTVVGDSTVGSEDDALFSSVRALIILKMLRLLKLARIARLSRVFGTLEAVVEMNPSLVKLLQLFGNVLYLMHLCACIWYFIGIRGWESRSEVEHIKSTWLLLPTLTHVMENATDTDFQSSVTSSVSSLFSGPTITTPTFAADNFSSSISSKYVAALYWASTTLTTTGYGDIIPVGNVEIIFTLFIECMGATVFAYVVNSVSMALNGLGSIESTKNIKVRELDDYLSEFSLPESLKHAVKLQWNHALTRSSAFKEDNIYNRLPLALQREVTYYLNQKIISKIPIFQAKSPSFVAHVLPLMKANCVPAGNLIVEAGEAGSELYFVVDGVVELLVDKPQDTQQPEIPMRGKPSSPSGLATENPGGKEDKVKPKPPSSTTSRSFPVLATMRHMPVREVLGSGCFFGHEALLNGTGQVSGIDAFDGTSEGLKLRFFVLGFTSSQPLTARAFVMTFLYVLKREDLHQLIVRFPETAAELQEALEAAILLQAIQQEKSRIKFAKINERRQTRKLRAAAITHGVPRGSVGDGLTPLQRAGLLARQQSDNGNNSSPNMSVSDPDASPPPTLTIKQSILSTKASHKKLTPVELLGAPRVLKETGRPQNGTADSLAPPPVLRISAAPTRNAAAGPIHTRRSESAESTLKNMGELLQAKLADRQTKSILEQSQARDSIETTVPISSTPPKPLTGTRSSMLRRALSLSTPSSPIASHPSSFAERQPSDSSPPLSAGASPTSTATSSPTTSFHHQLKGAGKAANAKTTSGVNSLAKTVKRRVSKSNVILKLSSKIQSRVAPKRSSSALQSPQGKGHVFSSFVKELSKDMKLIQTVAKEYQEKRIQRSVHSLVKNVSYEESFDDWLDELRESSTELSELGIFGAKHVLSDSSKLGGPHRLSITPASAGFVLNSNLEDAIKKASENPVILMTSHSSTPTSPSSNGATLAEEANSKISSRVRSHARVPSLDSPHAKLAGEVSMAVKDAPHISVNSLTKEPSLIGLRNTFIRRGSSKRLKAFEGDKRIQNVLRSHRQSLSSSLTKSTATTPSLLISATNAPGVPHMGPRRHSDGEKLALRSAAGPPTFFADISHASSSPLSQTPSPTARISHEPGIVVKPVNGAPTKAHGAVVQLPFSAGSAPFPGNRGGWSNLNTDELPGAVEQGAHQEPAVRSVNAPTKSTILALQQLSSELK